MVEFNSTKAVIADLAYQSAGVVNQRLRTVKAMALSNGSRALDVGCGTGLLLKDIAIAVGETGRAVGIDRSEDMLHLARERCAALPQTALIQGTIADCPQGEAPFDAVSYVQVLRYIDDVEQELSRAGTVLTRGGRLVIIETDWHGTVLGTDHPSITRRILDAHDDDVPRANLPTRLAGLLSSAGYTAVSVDAIPLLETNWSPGTFTFSMFRKYAELAVNRGAVLQEEADAWLNDFQTRNSAGNYFFCVNRFLFSCIKV